MLRLKGEIPKKCSHTHTFSSHLSTAPCTRATSRLRLHSQPMFSSCGAVQDASVRQTFIRRGRPAELVRRRRQCRCARHQRAGDVQSGRRCGGRDQPEREQPVPATAHHSAHEAQALANNDQCNCVCATRARTRFRVFYVRSRVCASELVPARVR